mgnify:CR=1 FL=1
MGIFGKRKIRIEDIVSVVLLEQTQNYSKRTRSGLVFGNSIFNPDVVLMDGNAEPTGATYTFSVTLKDGSKDIVKADSGTEPSVTAYATKDQLMDGTFKPKDDGTADNYGKLVFGKNSSGSAQEW